MRNKLEYIQVIDKYLRGVLSKEDTAIFDNRLATDSQLREEVAKQKLLMEGIKRNALKTSAQKGKKSYKRLKTLKALGIAVAVIAITALSVYTFSKTETKIEIQETTQANLGIESLENQGFTISTLSDTVIETENGIVLAIPSNAFETEEGESVSGDINFEIREAFDNVDIMKAGLTTTSDGELLETGGMFFLEASHKGKKLRLKKGKEILSQLPNLYPEKEMQLFDGEKKADGTINWVNPKPFEKDLVAVDITSLDFYPEGYVEEVTNTTKKVLVKAIGDIPSTKMTVEQARQLGYKYPSVWTEENALKLGFMTREYKEVKTKNLNVDKVFTDSLYYSFARLFTWESKPEIEKTEIDYIDQKIEIVDLDTVSFEEIKFSGKALFKQHCASCHKVNRDGTGPALNGVFQKWKDARDNIYRYIQNPMQELDRGVKSAILAENYSPTQMPGVGVSKEEIDAIFNYVDRFNAEKTAKASATKSCPIPFGINPAKVKAIWNKKFNNTILATKEFEERMKVIHESHQDRILQVYVSNLDKPLWYSDSIAMVTFSETSDKFRTFYLQKKDGVNLKDKSANKLSNYFNKKHKEFTTATSIAFKKYKNKKQQLRQEFQGVKNKKAQEEYNRKAKVFQEEYKINLCNAATQIGKKGYCGETIPNTVRVRRSKLTSRITTLGSKNIDAYVFEATRDRKSMVYTDPNSGKTATLTYKPMKVEISNAEKFDKVYIYLLPDTLSSFNRMKTKDNINFNFSLNMLFNYKLMAVGYKDKQAYFVELNLIKPQDYSISLIPISEEELNNKLSKDKGQVKQEILSDKNFYEEEIINSNRETKYKSDNELTLRIGKFLFPELGENCILNQEINYNDFSNSGLDLGF